MLPVAIAVLEKSPDEKLPVPLLLGIAYGASIGGIGTPIGTPPNLEFAGRLRTHFWRDHFLRSVDVLGHSSGVGVLADLRILAHAKAGLQRQR